MLHFLPPPIRFVTFPVTLLHSREALKTLAAACAVTLSRQIHTTPPLHVTPALLPRCRRRVASLDVRLGKRSRTQAPVTTPALRSRVRRRFTEKRSLERDKFRLCGTGFGAFAPTRPLRQKRAKPAPLYRRAERKELKWDYRKMNSSACALRAGRKTGSVTKRRKRA